MDGKIAPQQGDKNIRYIYAIDIFRLIIRMNCRLTALLN